MSNQSSNTVQIVNPSQLTISKEDLENLDTEKLSKVMMQSIYVIEASLFSQASEENSRIADLRGYIKNLEDSLMNEDLDPDQQMRLYSQVSSNLNRSMDFLTKLHSSISEGMESINKIESSRERTKSSSKSSRKSIESNSGKDELLSAIQKKIKEKKQRGLI